MNTGANSNPAPMWHFNEHDLKVLIFHALTIFLQGGLIALGKENFGSLTPYVAMVIQLALEFVRRLIV